MDVVETAFRTYDAEEATKTCLCGSCRPRIHPLNLERLLKSKSEPDEPASPSRAIRRAMKRQRRKGAQ